MIRERGLQVVLFLVGLLFTAGIYPLLMSLRHPGPSNDPGDTMMLSLYFTLGILLLIAVRNPAAHRSLIAFAAWSSFAHGAVMTIMALQNPSDRDLLGGVAILAVIGVLLVVLRPAKQSVERASAVGA